MPRNFTPIDDIPSPSTALTRVDLNSPVENGMIKDNRRFVRHAETVRDLSDANHRVVLLAHQGRPGRDDFYPLEQHASVLAEHVHRDVEYCPDTVGKNPSEAVEDLDPGSILLLENVRMTEAELIERSPEEHAETSFVKALARLGDVYVGDAYSSAHRSHASIVGLPQAMDSVFAGRVMAAEYRANSAIQSRSFDGPVTMVLGGTKADDLFRVMEGVSDTVDTFLMGGVTGELALRAQGFDLGYDVRDTELFDALWASEQSRIREILDRFGDRIVLPVDLAFEDDRGRRGEISVEEISKDRPYLDVGSETGRRFRREVKRSAAVFVKGALGVFEDDRFSQGTVGVLRAIAAADAFSVVGGGDTSRAVDLYDLDPAAFDHLSIAGGAYVRALAGESLPGVAVLQQ